MTTNCQHEFDAIDLPCAYCGKTQGQIQIEESFERVKRARKALIEKRSGRKYNQQQPERTWKKPHNDD